jgi:PAS domain S-box-containing protein
VSPSTNTADLEHSADGPLGPEQLARIVDLSPDAILVLDKDDVIRVWNKGAEHIFGYSAEEAVGRDFDMLVPADLVREDELRRIRELTDDVGELRDYRTKRMTKDGRELVVSLARRRLLDVHGEFSGTIAILRDISETMRLRQQATDAKNLAAIGNIASQVAHEIRNPLAGIHGALQVLRRRFPPNSGEQEIFVGLTDEIRRLDGLVSDLQRFGRPVAVHPEYLDLAEWLRKWTQRAPDAVEQELVMNCTAPTDLPTHTDPMILQDLLLALASNTIENFGEFPGPIAMHFELSLSPTHAVLDIFDNGPGIPDDMSEQLWAPFVTSKTRGSGLGLAICRRNVENMGGTLDWLGNGDRDDMPGAHFRICLPQL